MSVKLDGAPHASRTFTDATLPKLDQLQRNGWSQREIAEALGVILGAVTRAINRQGAYAGVAK